MRLVFLILIIILPKVSFSKEIIGKITCSSNIKYAYINGILNYKNTDAEESAVFISKKVINSNEITTIFNQSEGFLEDIKRAIAQKVEEAGKSSFVGNLFIESLGIRAKDNRVSINKELNKLSKNGTDLIVFSHSQGNLYTNIGCEELSKSGRDFKNIQIASPANGIRCGKKNHYTILSSDEMYQLVNYLTNPKAKNIDVVDKEIINFIGTSVANQIVKPLSRVNPIQIPLKANITQSRRNGFVFQDFEYHSMENYMNYGPSVNNIKKHHNEVLKSLKGNQILTKRPAHIHCGNVDNWVGQSLLTPNDINGKSYKTDFFTDMFTSYNIEPVGEQSPEGFSPEYKTYILTKSFSWLKFFIIIPIAIIFSLPILLIIFKGSKETLDNMETYEEEQERLRREREGN